MVKLHEVKPGTWFIYGDSYCRKDSNDPDGPMIPCVKRNDDKIYLLRRDSPVLEAKILGKEVGLYQAGRIFLNPEKNYFGWKIDQADAFGYVLCMIINNGILESIRLAPDTPMVLVPEYKLHVTYEL